MGALEEYELDEEALITMPTGEVPLIYWPVAPNFGDLLSPWLFEQLTKRKVVRLPSDIRPVGQYPTSLRRSKIKKWMRFRRANAMKNYIAIGSIMSRVNDSSVVWGTGSFGTEQFSQINRKADFRAVRGPLSRQLLLNAGLKDIPEVYGDPALLVPEVFNEDVRKTHEYGLVVRWSDNGWKDLDVSDEVKIIDLKSRDVTETLRQILSCRKIITSSLHGLIVADAFCLPNAYLHSETPKGGIFKYLDYFASVDKFRLPAKVDLNGHRVDREFLERSFDFDDRPISFDGKALLDACPFLKRIV